MVESELCDAKIFRMTNKESYEYILKLLPYTEPFLFVDDLIEVNDMGVLGSYTYSPKNHFYRGHFKNYPITPGVILTETMAQIGLVCLGIHLLTQKENITDQLQIAMTSSEVEYLLPVHPGEKVLVESEKIYFRFGKLKCKVEMRNSEKKIVCQGVISGMMKLPSQQPLSK